MSIIPSTGLCTFILSAQRDDNSPSDNSHRHNLLMQNLAHEFSHGHIFALYQCRGHYKGTRERSIAVLAPAGWMDKAISVGRGYDQESVLEIDYNGVGRLYYCAYRGAAEVEVLGDYKEVESVRGLDGWTHVLGTGHRFTFA